MATPSTSFSITFSMVQNANPSQLHPVDRVRTRTPMPSRVQQLLDDHNPWEMTNNIALIIVDQTFSALLEILGPVAPRSDDGHVEVSRPVDPADPDSPLLCVNASATHCCICLINGGVTHEYKTYKSLEQKSKPQYRLARASVSVAPGTLHLARLADGGGPGGCWKCADVRPKVSEKGLFGVLETIKSRLDAAIRLEARLIEMAKASGCKSPKINEIVEVRMALEKMRAEVDLDAIMRRMRQKRRRNIQEIGCRPDADPLDSLEALAKRLKGLHVCQKRCRPAAEMDQVDDAEVLTKRLRALRV